MDAVKIKSRMFVIQLLGFIFVLANINNVYNLIFGNWDQGVVLFKYTIQENEYTFMKRSAKLSIYIQVLLFSMNGIYTIFNDRKQELMIFATGNIYRETGTGQENETNDGNVRITTEVEVQPKTRDRKARHNSWADIYNENTPCANTKGYWGRKSRQTMGWSGASSGVNAGWGCAGLLALICYVAGQNIATIVFGALYAYISWYIVLQKRLVCDCETIVARNQRGDYSRVRSVQLEY